MEKIVDGFKWEILPYEKAHECTDTERCLKQLFDGAN